MIQIYKPDNLNYDNNGDMILFPTSATIQAVLNGTWLAKISCPIDVDGAWKYITENAVVKMPSFNGLQLFRIKQREKTDKQINTVLEPIFMDAKNDCWLVDVRPTKKNGQQALDLMTAPNKKYKGVSDIVGTSTAYYEFKNLVEAINGNIDQSFVNRWGGEILFDNYTIHINQRVGTDRGVELRYGKNIAQDGIVEGVETRNIITRIYPKAYNGHTMTNKGYIDSPLINTYPNVRVGTITFENVKMREDVQEEDEERGVIICDTQAQLDKALTEQCKDEFKKGVDKPEITLSIDMTLLGHTEEYKEFEELESVSLGDTIHCRHNKLGIVSDARILELEYDALEKCVTSVVVGGYTYNYFNNVNSAVNRIENAIRPDGSIVAEEIRGFINAMEASLKLQSTAAKKVDGRAFLIEDLDKLSGLFGAMEAGTQGLRISKRRTADDRAWVWTTAITALGIIADAIVTGSLTSKNWKKNEAGFRLNLDEGTINSKHLRLDVDGLLTVYKALIDGGEITIKTPAGKRVLHVNEDETVIGADGKEMKYDAKTGLLTMVKALISGGEITINDTTGNRILHVNESEFVVGNSNKGLRWDAKTGLFTLYKALISGGEITINDTAGNRIFRVTEKDGFVFGDGETGIIRYDTSDKLLKMYKDIILRGNIINYSASGKKSIKIGGNRIDVYSWQSDGNWIGGIGSLYAKNAGTNIIGLFCDQGDQISISYLDKIENGTEQYGNFMRFDHRQLGNDPLDFNSERAIKFAETPSIVNNPGGTLWIGPTKLHLRSGIIVKIEGGNTISGTFKTGAGETVTLNHGAVVSVE